MFEYIDHLEEKLAGLGETIQGLNKDVISGRSVRDGIGKGDYVRKAMGMKPYRRKTASTWGDLTDPEQGFLGRPYINPGADIGGIIGGVGGYLLSRRFLPGNTAANVGGAAIGSLPGALLGDYIADRIKE